MGIQLCLRIICLKLGYVMSMSPHSSFLFYIVMIVSPCFYFIYFRLIVFYKLYSGHTIFHFLREYIFAQNFMPIRLCFIQDITFMAFIRAKGFKSDYAGILNFSSDINQILEILQHWYQYSSRARKMS